MAARWKHDGIVIICAAITPRMSKKKSVKWELLVTKTRKEREKGGSKPHVIRGGYARFLCILDVHQPLLCILLSDGVHSVSIQISVKL